MQDKPDINYDLPDDMSDKKLIEKFYRRFPALKLMPNYASGMMEFGRTSPVMNHPAIHFLRKYKELKAKGYSEYKAFSTVEQELEQVFDKQRDDLRILRGGALAAHGDSYLDRA